MLMNVLDRPGDGCGAMKQILLTNHEPRRRQRSHIKRAISIYRSLLAADVVETLDEPDDQGRTVRVTIDLQDDFALTHPLSLFAVEAIDALEKDAPDYELNVLSVVEAVIESPGVIMAAQLNQLRGELVTGLKSAGVEYDERMEKLDALEAPKPLADFLYPAFDIFRQHHPWVGQDNVRPKSIARELWERAMTFSEYIQHYGLKRSEGVLLRYLSDAYKGLVQNVPEDAKTDELYDLTDWLGEVVRQVDSSLLDEWERLTNPTDDPQAPVIPERRDVTQTHAFRTMVRNEAFRWIQLLARRRTASLADISALSSEEIAEQWAVYFEEHEEVVSGPTPEDRSTLSTTPTPATSPRQSSTLTTSLSGKPWARSTSKPPVPKVMRSLSSPASPQSPRPNEPVPGTCALVRTRLDHHGGFCLQCCVVDSEM